MKTLVILLLFSCFLFACQSQSEEERLAILILRDFQPSDTTRLINCLEEIEKYRQKQEHKLLPIDGLVYKALELKNENFYTDFWKSYERYKKEIYLKREREFIPFLNVNQSSADAIDVIYNKQLDFLLVHTAAIHSDYYFDWKDVNINRYYISHNNVVDSVRNTFLDALKNHSEIPPLCRYWAPYFKIIRRYEFLRSVGTIFPDFEHQNCCVDFVAYPRLFQ